jgi:CheY-like chemotaxis protein
MKALRILIVDDDSGIRLTIRKILESEKTGSYEVVEASDGVECLMAAEKRGPFDLILLDVEMPQLDGFAVCKAIRRVDTKVPIVFVTSHADVEHRVKGREAGGDSFLAKPVRPGPLMSLVRLFASSSKR